MSLLKGLLFIALSLQPWYADQKSETHQDRVVRYATIAEGITQTVEEVTCTGSQKTNKNCKKSWGGNPDKLGYILLTLAYQESKFSRNVHAGKCGPYECDAYKDADGNIQHRATSLWQIQSSTLVPYEQWKRLSGLDEQSTAEAAKVAFKIFASGYRKCKTVTGGISQYAGVARCDWPRAQFRADFAERLYKKAKQYENANWIRSPGKNSPDPESTDIQIGGEVCTVTKQGKGLSFTCVSNPQPPATNTKHSDMVAMAD